MLQPTSKDIQKARPIGAKRPIATTSKSTSKESPQQPTPKSGEPSAADAATSRPPAEASSSLDTVVKQPKPPSCDPPAYLVAAIAQSNAPPVQDARSESRERSKSHDDVKAPCAGLERLRLQTYVASLKS